MTYDALLYTSCPEIIMSEPLPMALAVRMTSSHGVPNRIVLADISLVGDVRQ